MSLESLFEHLHDAYQFSQQAADMVGRLSGLRWGIVTELGTTPDQLKLAMIRVMLPHQGAANTSNWLMRIVPWNGLSVPMPRVGDTVLVGYDDGNPNQVGFYVGIPNNNLNPAFSDPAIWRYDFNPDIFLEVSKDHVQFSAFNNVLTITKDAVDITAKALTFNGNGGQAITASGGDLNITSPNKVKIQYKNAAVIGAVDDRGDKIVTSGQ